MDISNIKSSYLNLNEKEISEFIVWDYLNFFEQTGAKNLKETLFNKYSFVLQEYKKYKPALNFFDNIFLKLLAREDNKKILFEGIKYSSIVLETKKYYRAGLIVKDAKDRLFSFKNFMGYLNLTDLYQYVYYYLAENNIKYLYQLIEKIENRLKLIKPAYIVLWNDAMPVERAIVLAGKKLGITTLEIQHGVYQSDFPLTNGKVADYVLVWGQHFKDMYIKQRIKRAEEIYILGYPYLTEKPHLSDRTGRDYVVYYFSGAFEKFNQDSSRVELETINNLNRICKRLKLNFICRPHPSEDIRVLSKKLPEVNFAPKHERLDSSIERGDIFIALSSTALIEAAIRSKVTLQLLSSFLETNSDNYEKLGIVNKSFAEIAKLAEYLEFLSKLPNLNQARLEFNAEYIETKYHPGKRFMEILKDIENKK